MRRSRGLSTNLKRCGANPPNSRRWPSCPDVTVVRCTREDWPRCNCLFRKRGQDTGKSCRTVWAFWREPGPQCVQFPILGWVEDVSILFRGSSEAEAGWCVSGAAKRKQAYFAFTPDGKGLRGAGGNYKRIWEFLRLEVISISSTPRMTSRFAWVRSQALHSAFPFASNPSPSMCRKVSTCSS